MAAKYTEEVLRQVQEAVANSVFKSQARSEESYQRAAAASAASQAAKQAGLAGAVTKKQQQEFYQPIKVSTSGTSEGKYSNPQTAREEQFALKKAPETKKQTRDRTKKEYDDYVKSDEYKKRVTENDQKARAEAAAQMFLNPGQPMPQPKVIQDEREMQLRAAMETAEQEYNAAEDDNVIAEDLEAITGLSNEERRELELYAVNQIRDQNLPVEMVGVMPTAQQEASGLIGKYGKQRVDEMAETFMRQENADMARKVDEKTREFVNKRGLSDNLADIATIPAVALSGLVGTVGQLQGMARNTGRYKTLDPYATGTIGDTFVGAARGQHAQNLVDDFGGGFLGKAAAVGYQGIMSAADSIARAVLGGGAVGGAALAATGSFSQTMAEASRQGASPAQAALLATVNSGIEALSEKIPLDNLIRTAKGTGAKTVLLNALRQMGIEATTEEISLLGTVLAEAAILQEKSSYKQDIIAGITSGLSVDDAIIEANKKILGEALNTLLVSAASGGASSLTGSYADARGLFAQEQEQNNPALNQPKQSDVVKSVEDLRQKYGQPEAQQAAEQPKQAAAPAVEAQTTQTTEQAAQAPQQPQEEPRAKQSTVIDSVVETIQRNGGNVTNRMAESVLNDTAAKQQLFEQIGMEISGSKSQQRQIVKDALSQMAASQDTQAETAQNPPTAEPMQATETSEQATNQASAPQKDMQTGASNQSAEGGQIKGTGAAERNFSGVAAYEDMLSDDNVQRKRPNAVRDVEMPKVDSDGRRVTEFAKNVADAEVTPEPLADAVKSLVGDKKLSFDTRSNQESLNNAAEAIRTQGDTAVIADIHAHAEAKTVKDGDIEKGLVLYAQYANDPDPKSQETAAQIIVDMAALANMSGRNLQLFSLMQRMTPEGRIKVLKKDLSRSIKQINAGRSKNKQVDLSKPGVMTDKKATEAVTTARKNTEKQVRGASDRVRYRGGKVEVEGSHQKGEPFVFEYAQKVGEALAKGLENSQKKKPKKTFLQTMTSELRKFASEKMPAGQKEKQMTPTELLRDYIQNQEFYAEAWSAAQETLREKHADDPAYQEFMNTGIGVDANANPQNRIMAKALTAAAMETGETTEMLRKQQALGITGMSDNIANKLIRDTGATGEMAQTIRDAAYEFVKSRINEADSKKNARTYDASYFVNEAMRDIKRSMADVAKKNSQGRDAVKQAVINSLTRKYNIGLTDARNIAEVIGDTFDQKAQDQARKILEQKFGEREKKQPKSAGQMIEEYANLGAFGQESQYSEQATESFLRAAMRDIGTTVSELARSGKADKEAVRNQVALMITERHGINKADAHNIARVVVDQMNQMTEAQARKILEQKFADRPGHNKKTSHQVFEELANLGAFDVGSKFNDAASKKVLGDDVDVHINEELAQKFLDAKTDKEKEAVMDEIYKDVASRIKPTIGEVWDAWRNLAMLGNFKTHERNIFSTAAYQPYQSVKRGIGTVLEKVLRIDPEQRTKSVLGVGKKSQDLLKWAKTDARTNEARNLMQRSGTTGNEGRSAIQEYRKILPGILDKASKKNMELMENADMRFKQREYALSLASFLKARGYTAADIQNGNVPNGVLDKGRQIAVREAMKATFNDSNKLSDAAVKYLKSNERNGNVVLNIVKKGTIPFLRTPANVVARAVENNPLSLIPNLVTAKKDIESGRKSVADVLDGLSANLAGGVGVALGALLGSDAFENVELIGSIEDEEELREGAQEYSVRIGDKYYNVAWLSPAMIPLFLGANLARNKYFAGFQDADGWDIAKAVVDLGADTLEPILELSMLSSLNDAVQKFTSEEDPGDGAMAVFLNSLTSYVQQGLPTIIGQAEQATETEKSSTFVNTGNKLEEIVKVAVSNATKRIPGKDLYQTKKLDEWGNVVQNEGDAFDRIVNSFFNPFTVTTRKTDAVTQEITRLNRAGENVTPDYFSKTISYVDKDGFSHDDVRLTEEQFQTLAETQGQTARKLVEDMIQSKAYQALTDEQKAEAIDAAYLYARKTGEIAAIGESHTGYDQSWMYDVNKGGGANELMRRVFNSSLNTSMSDLDNAWEKGYNEETFSRDMEEAYDSYKKAPASMRGDIYAEATGTAKRYMEARDKGLTHKEVISAIENVVKVHGTGAVNKETGKPTVRDIDRRKAIASTPGLSESAKDILMKAYMADYDPSDESPETTEFKYDYARKEMGLSATEYADTYKAYLDSDKKRDKVAAIRALGYDYGTALALYNLYNGRKKNELIKLYG